MCVHRSNVGSMMNEPMCVRVFTILDGSLSLRGGGKALQSNESKQTKEKKKRESKPLKSLHRLRDKWVMTVIVRHLT